jgi:hypothetical protein
LCTLTFIPNSLENFVLTSNRDEAPRRGTIRPMMYTEDGVQLMYPKDELAGGSWIGISDKKRAVCLLNGGFAAHQREERYRMSRGIIVKDLLVSDAVLNKIDTYDFSGIEPFTIVIVDWNINLRIFELVWDGTNQFFTEKPLAPQIWSSSLLYSSEVKKKREQWFSAFLFSSLRPACETILNFHKTAGEGNNETNLVMDRGYVATKSITQIIKDDSIVKMRYEDLESKNITNNQL